MTNLEFTSCVLLLFVDCVAFELVHNKSAADRGKKLASESLYYDTDMGQGSAYKVTPSSLKGTAFQKKKNHVTLKQIRNGT